MVLCAIFFITGCEKNTEGVLEDSRDGKVYKTVKIGEQTWMAENLNYKTKDSYYRGWSIRDVQYYDENEARFIRCIKE